MMIQNSNWRKPTFSKILFPKFNENIVFFLFTFIYYFDFYLLKICNKRLIRSVALSIVLKWEIMRNFSLSRWKYEDFRTTKMIFVIFQVLKILVLYTVLLTKLWISLKFINNVHSTLVHIFFPFCSCGQFISLNYLWFFFFSILVFLMSLESHIYLQFYRVTLLFL